MWQGCRLSEVLNSCFRTKPRKLTDYFGKSRGRDGRISIWAIQRTADSRKRADARYQRGIPKADHHGAGRLPRRVADMDQGRDRGKGGLNRIRRVSSRPRCSVGEAALFCEWTSRGLPGLAIKMSLPLRRASLVVDMSTLRPAGCETVSAARRDRLCGSTDVPAGLSQPAGKCARTLAPAARS